MIVFVPTPIQNYTGGLARVDGAGSTLAEVLADLDVRYPGIRNRIIDEQGRIREHMKLFVNADHATGLAHRVTEGDAVSIIAALSGG